MAINTNFETVRPSKVAMGAMGIKPLKNNPNRQSPLGDGLSPEELKARFDALSEYLADKLNVLVNLLASDEIANKLQTGFDSLTIQEKLQELTTRFANYRTSAELAATVGGTTGASLIGAKKKISSSSVAYAPLQVLLDDIFDALSNRYIKSEVYTKAETFSKEEIMVAEAIQDLKIRKIGNTNIDSVAEDITSAILVLKALIDNTYPKSQTYSKTEINSSQATQDNRLTALETKQGTDNITDIAPDISKAILSLNEDIDSLQLGVVPRAIRGIIQANTSYGALTEELKALLTAKVTETTGRTTPNNTDAVQVFDTGEPDKNIMYTYYYWDSNVNENVPSELNGWYLAYSALSQTINNEECYTLNFNTSAWALGQDGYYYIEKTAQDHNMGTDNTIDIKVLKLIDGNYEEIRQFYVSASGTVTLYTDEVFSGTLTIRTGKAFRVPTLVVSQSQIDGLEEDLIALNTNKADKTAISNVDNTSDLDKPVSIAQQEYMNNLIPYDKVIRTQAEFELLIESPTWLGATAVAFVGQFTLSTANNSGIKIPPTVKQIHGFNSAKITITNFLYNGTSAKGGLWYDTLPTTLDYSICDLAVDCTGTGNGYGFNNCTNLTNCTGTGTGTGTAIGFNNCTNLTNCTGTGTGTGTGAATGFNNCTNLTNCTGTGTGTEAAGYGFYSIDYASNCKDGGSTTAMWGGANQNINLETCRKTAVTADNAILNA